MAIDPRVATVGMVSPLSIAIIKTVVMRIAPTFCGGGLKSYSMVAILIGEYVAIK